MAVMSWIHKPAVVWGAGLLCVALSSPVQANTAWNVLDIVSMPINEQSKISGIEDPDKVYQRLRTNTRIQKGQSPERVLIETWKLTEPGKGEHALYVMAKTALYQGVFEAKGIKLTREGLIAAANQDLGEKPKLMRALFKGQYSEPVKTVLSNAKGIAKLGEYTVATRDDLYNVNQLHAEHWVENWQAIVEGASAMGPDWMPIRVCKVDQFSNQAIEVAGSEVPEILKRLGQPSEWKACWSEQELINQNYYQQRFKSLLTQLGHWKQ